MMATEFREVRRDITFFLGSLRQTVERSPWARSKVMEIERTQFTKTMLHIEEARIRFNSYIRYRSEPNAKEWSEMREALLSLTEKFLKREEVHIPVLAIKFRPYPPLFRDRETPTPFIERFLSKDLDWTIEDALGYFRAYLEFTNLELAPVQVALGFEQLKRIVPGQQIAPVQFDIVNSRIIIAKQLPQIEAKDKGNIKSAVEYIASSGERLIANLEASNCDPRLLNTLRDLHSQVTSDSNIVKLGLSNISCGIMSTQFQDELPDAIVAMFNSYNASISLYVAQYPEWEQFTYKATLIEIDDRDIVDVDAAAENVISALKEAPELADPEVPKTIAVVRDFLSFPRAFSKRAVFAMVRTLENLVSVVLRYSADLFDKTAEKFVDKGSTVASNIMIGLLSVALLGAIGIAPAAVQAGAPWVQQAVDIVRKQIEKMSE